MKRSVMIVVLLSATSVFAQEEANELLPSQPPATREELPAPPAQPPPRELPPILVVPPGYPPPLVIPAVEQIQALEESGHNKKTLGAVLQTAGGLLAFTGATLLVAASWSDDGACSRNDDHGTWVIQSYTTGGPSGSRATPQPSCGDGTLAFAGGITLLFGVVMILPGVALSQSGIVELARARRLRRSHGIEWSLRPSVGAHGAHAHLAMRF